MPLTLAIGQVGVGSSRKYETQCCGTSNLIRLSLAPPSALCTQMRVACLGDSITRGDARHEAGRGTHLPFKKQTAGRGSYPATLQQLLGATSATVANFGHGQRTLLDDGEATKPYRRTAEWAEAQRFGASHVVLMLGTNDCQRRVWMNASRPQRFSSQLAAMARTILAWPTRPALLLMVPPPVRRRTWCAGRTTLRGEIAPRIAAAGSSVKSSRVSPCKPGTIHVLDLQAVPPFDGCALLERHRAERTRDCHRTPACRDTLNRKRAQEATCAPLYTPDGIHTSERGSDAIATAVHSVLGACANLTATFVRHSRLEDD